MTAIPAVRAARGGLSGRKVQAIVIGAVVLVSTAASTLALSMLADSSTPFDHAFAAQGGAQVTATVTGATAAELDATAHLTGVTAAGGPFPGTTVTAKAQLTPGGPPGGGPGNGPGGTITVTQQLNLVGRSSPGGPVDDLVLTSGHWATGPGQVVWAGNSQGLALGPGTQLTVAGTDQRLTVVGVATSITDTAQGWVTPSEIAALESRGALAAGQMLYRFASAGSAAHVSSDISEVRAALPRGDLAGAQSYLTAKLQAASGIAPWVPFIVAFGLIGLVMSVLIVANVVSGAVVAGTQRIGVLKSIGFSPAQVVAVYVLQVAVPALLGCAAGVAAGNLLAVPLLSQQAQVYGVGRLAVPFWVDLAVPLSMLALAVLAAVALAMRAGRMSATAAIATGRAPRPRHGYLAHRLHWYSGPHQVDVNTAFLASTGLSVGDSYTLTSGGRRTAVTIAGEVFDPQGGTAEMIGAQSTFSPVDPQLEPGEYDVALEPGTSLSGYVNALARTVGPDDQVIANTASSSNYAVIIGLITTMTLLLAAVAALGVLNTVVLQTRERVHDLGVFKAVGMTPRQTVAMVVCSVAGVGLLAGLIAVPLGVALHRYVLPIMGNAAQTGVPASFLNVYHPAELALLGLAGLAIAVAGALAPAGWAAETRTASALRAE